MQEAIAEAKSTKEKPPLVNKLMKKVKPIFKCPAWDCEYEFNSKAEVKLHLMTAYKHDNYRMSQQLKAEEWSD